MVSNAIENLKHQFPFYFLDYREKLNSALKELEKTMFSFGNFDDVFKNQVRKQVKESLHQSNAYSHVGKVFQTMRRMVSFESVCKCYLFTRLCHSIAPNHNALRTMDMLPQEAILLLSFGHHSEKPFLLGVLF